MNSFGLLLRFSCNLARNEEVKQQRKKARSVVDYHLRSLLKVNYRYTESSPQRSVRFEDDIIYATSMSGGPARLAPAWHYYAKGAISRGRLGRGLESVSKNNLRARKRAIANYCSRGGMKSISMSLHCMVHTASISMP